MSDESTTCRLPVELEGVKEALPGAVYYLALGERPTTPPGGEMKMTRISLNPRIEAYIEKLIPVFGSRTKVIQNALAWFNEQDRRSKLLIGSIKL